MNVEMSDSDDVLDTEEEEEDGRPRVRWVLETEKSKKRSLEIDRAVEFAESRIEQALLEVWRRASYTIAVEVTEEYVVLKCEITAQRTASRLHVIRAQLQDRLACRLNPFTVRSTPDAVTVSFTASYYHY